MGDYDLKKSLQKMGNKRWNFGLYRGDDANQVLVTPQPAKPKQVEEIEKECGPVKRLVKGICYYENNVLVFASKTSPAPAWEMLITKVFKDQKCTSFLPINLRKLGENESDEALAEEGEGGATEAPTPGAIPPPPPPPPAAEASAAWKQIKAAVTLKLAPLIAARSPTSAPLLQLVREALAKEKESLWAEATALFQQVEQQLAAPAPVVATAPEPTAKAPEQSSEQLQAALQALTPRIKAAIVASPVRKEELLRPVTEFQSQMKAGQLGPAGATLARLEALLQMPVAPGPKVAEKAPEIRTGTVEYAKLRLAWDATKKSVQADLQGLEKTILETFAGAPGLSHLAQKIRKFDDVLGGFAEDLSDQLDLALNSADPVERTKFHQQAAATIKRFHARALSDPFIERLQDNPFRAIKVKPTLVKTLENLATRLV